MNITVDLTQVVISLISLAFTVIAGYVTKVLLPKVDAWLDAKVSAAQRKNIAELLSTFCKAAEQLYTDNEDKLDYVFKMAEEKGIIIDRAEVEAAVYDLKLPLMEAVYEAVEGEE